MGRLGVLLAVVAMVLAGCGQKGPLYRPEEDSLARDDVQGPVNTAPTRAHVR